MLAITKATRTRLATMILAAAFLTACDNKIDGTYSINGSASENVTFKPDGKVEITYIGMKQQGTYERLESKKIKIVGDGSTPLSAPRGPEGGNLLLIIDDKGCLVSMGGDKYCKK